MVAIKTSTTDECLFTEEINFQITFAESAKRQMRRVVLQKLSVGCRCELMCVDKGSVRSTRKTPFGVCLQASSLHFHLQRQVC